MAVKMTLTVVEILVYHFSFTLIFVYLNFVTVQPNVTTNCTKSITVNEGDDVTCLCNSSNGNPPPTASWSKDGNTGVIDEVGYLQKTLSLKNISKDNNGTYICTVQSHDLRSTTFVHVVVRVRPTATTNCSNVITVNEGDDVTCLCNSSSGNPPPTASWSNDGDTGVIDGVGYLQKTLSLKNISKENNGTYICKVQSHDLINTTSVHVVVHFKPKVVSFKSDKENNTAIVGKKLTITCMAEGYPAPEYVIIHNAVQLPGVVNGVKRFDQVTYHNAGRYECLAKNIVKTVSKSFYLIVISNCSNCACTKSTGKFLQRK